MNAGQEIVTKGMEALREAIVDVAGKLNRHRTDLIVEVLAQGTDTYGTKLAVTGVEVGERLEVTVGQRSGRLNGAKVGPWGNVTAPVSVAVVLWLDGQAHHATTRAERAESLTYAQAGDRIGRVLMAYLAGDLVPVSEVRDARAHGQAIHGTAYANAETSHLGEPQAWEAKGTIRKAQAVKRYGN